MFETERQDPADPVAGPEDALQSDGDDGGVTGGGGDGLRLLGEMLEERVDELVPRILARTRGSSAGLDEADEETLASIAAMSTVAVARWMAGVESGAASGVGGEAGQILAQLAGRGDVPLDKLAARFMSWRECTAAVLSDSARQLELDGSVLGTALAMLQQSLDATLVRLCECFESERRRSRAELERRQRELTFLASHDPLTGLPNRALIVKRIEEMLVRSQRTHVPVIALIIDVDDFKSINDTLGHSAGDELLKALSARLEGVLRGGDVLGRLGGDEFAVIAEGNVSGETPALLAERLLAALQRPFKQSGTGEAGLTLSASLGAASGRLTSAEELLRDADVAMHRAKLEGQNRFIEFRSEMQDELQSRFEIETDLRGAIENDQLYLVYQPILSLRDLTPIAVEALLRWRHPRRGTIMPVEFIPALERTGLILPAGRFVLEEACRQVIAWRRAGHQVTITLNVSGLQIEREEFASEVEAALRASGLEGASLMLEITEATLMRDPEATARQLVALKQLGVRVAVDDFGTGYSSLAHLQRIPIDALKIDRSFTSRLGQDQDARTMIRTLIQLGRALSLETTVEGIEQESHLAIIQREGALSGQGYLFARPLDANGCGEFLSSWEGSESRARALAANLPAAAPPAEEPA